MNILQQKCLWPLLLVILSGQQTIAHALDSGEKDLGNTVGAVDYYKITCAVDTEHLNFKIKDNTSVSVTPPAPQLLNAHVTKDGFDPLDILALKSGDDPAELDFSGGNGKYTIKLDTIGTNPDLKNSQTYTIQYQCLSADNLVLKKYSATKKLKNDKTAKIVANCKTKKINKIPVNTDRLHIRLTNITPSADNQSQMLNAEVIHGNKVNTTFDVMGDGLYGKEVNLHGGSGDYFLMVNQTGSDQNQNNAKPYEFQTSCVDASNNETQSPVITVLQDQ